MRNRRSIGVLFCCLRPELQQSPPFSNPLRNGDRKLLLDALMPPIRQGPYRRIWGIQEFQANDQASQYYTPHVWHETPNHNQSAPNLIQPNIGEFYIRLQHAVWSQPSPFSRRRLRILSPLLAHGSITWGPYKLYILPDEHILYHPRQKRNRSAAGEAACSWICGNAAMSTRGITVGAQE